MTFKSKTAISVPILSLCLLGPGLDSLSYGQTSSSLLYERYLPPCLPLTIVFFTILFFTVESLCPLLLCERCYALVLFYHLQWSNLFVLLRGRCYALAFFTIYYGQTSLYGKLPGHSYCSYQASHTSISWLTVFTRFYCYGDA